MSLSTMVTFGALLRQLRRRAAMTQNDLAAAVGYSVSFISSLERNSRQPDVQTVLRRFIPALGLREEPGFATQLLELAVITRGDLLPTGLNFTYETHSIVTDPLTEPPVHLPTHPSALIGRQQEVKTLCNRLLGHSGRLLTLVGPPGIGKTRLALAVAECLQNNFPDGAFFVPLAEITDPVLMASAILIGVRSSAASPKPPKIELIARLRRKNMLLVLDNCEQIHDAAPLVAEVLSSCPGVVVLATSRERLHLRAEQRYRVPPLELATSVELFTQRAAAVDARFTLTEMNRPVVEAICERLDRLPLALELCAAQSELFSPTQLLAELKAHPLDLLVDGAHDLPPQQRTLRRAIQRSYQLLGEEERTLLRSLGIFVGGFAFPEVEMVSLYQQEPQTRPLLAVLQALVHKSLVRNETTHAGEQRFLLLETIREFALEQVRTHGEEAWLRQRHFATYLQLFRRADRYLRGPESKTWFERLTLEQDNLRTALEWAFDQGRYADAAWLLVAVFWFWFHQGHWYEQCRWIARLLPHRHLLDVDLRIAVLLNLWAVARVSEEFLPVDRWTGEVMQLLELCPHPLMHAAAWHSTASYSHHDLPRATNAWERSIAFARTASQSPPLSAEFGIVSDRDYRLGFSLWAYADRLIEYGKFAQALPLLTESQAIFQERGSRYEIVNSLGTFGRMALLQGDLAQAHKLLCEAVAISIEFNYHEMLGHLQGFLGLATLYHGTIAEAHRILSKNNIFCTDLKDKGLAARNSIYLAETALAEGLLDEAEQWLMQSFTYYSSPRRIRIDQMERLFVAARLAAAQQHYLHAATLFGLAEQIRSYLDYVVTGPRRTLLDAALATVQVALDQAVLTQSFAAGQQMSLEEAYATILTPSHFKNTATTNGSSSSIPKVGTLRKSRNSSCVS